MQKGNTELSREAQPILDIEAADGSGWNYTAKKSNGITIEPYDELGDLGFVPWVAVFSTGGRCIFRVRADKCLIRYSLSELGIG